MASPDAWAEEASKALPVKLVALRAIQVRAVKSAMLLPRG